MRKVNLFILVVMMTFVLSFMVISAEETPDFGDVTITAFCDAGWNTLAFDWYADEFAKAGIKVNMTTAPFANVYEKLKSEFIVGTGSIDLIVYYPMLLGEFAGMGYLEPLDQYTEKYDPHLGDIAEGFLKLYCYYGGDLYTLPYDGDVLSLYYRLDLFEDETEKENFKEKYGKELAPPATWDEVLDVAEFFTRKKGDTLAGEVLESDVYGYAFIAQRGAFAFAWWGAEFASRGGQYFDEDMNPTINSEAGVIALQRLVDILPYCPPDVLSYAYEELRDAFLLGRTAMILQWPDIWKRGNDPDQSVIVGNVGITHTPGIIEDGELKFRAPMTCGRVMSVVNGSKNPEAAYYVAKLLSDDFSIDIVSSSETGEDPFRKSHFNQPDAFLDFGTEEEAKMYLAAIDKNLTYGFPDLSIPGAAQYIDILELNLGKAFTEELSPKEALDAAAEEWDQITNSLGRENQAKIYNDILVGWREAGLVD
jgi:multiple sugar transport system substrate-binding protein